MNVREIQESELPALFDLIKAKAEFDGSFPDSSRQKAEHQTIRRSWQGAGNFYVMPWRRRVIDMSYMV